VTTLLHSKASKTLTTKPRKRTLVQRWHNLLFLHWEYPADAIQERLPHSLTVDTFNGKAYIAIVAFYMHGLRPPWAPPVPGISSFPELNLRTYVRDQWGRQGVWFFSLDARSRLSSWIARRFFNLNYRYAPLQHKLDKHGTVQFGLVDEPDHTADFAYRPTGTQLKPEQGELEHFLVERYRLFTNRKTDRLRSGQIHHQPYPLYKAKVERYSDALFERNNLPAPNAPFQHAHFSPGVDVSIFPLQDLKPPVG